MSKILIVGGGAAGMMAGVYPVSYTHLDVYKRQERGTGRIVGAVSAFPGGQAVV